MPSDSITLDYQRRFNRVVDHILEHLPERLTLARLAAVACFSPFHFHRLFQALMGESVKEFITRVRLERALVLCQANPQRSLKEVALSCGFGSAAVFSRTCRRVYGAAPSEVRQPDFLRSRKRQRGEDLPAPSHYYLRDFPADGSVVTVSVEEFPEIEFAYLRVTNSYAGTGVAEAYARMLAWTREVGLHAGNARLIGMSQDHPEITPLAKCRYDLGVTLPPGLEPPADFSRRRLPAAKFAVSRCQGDLQVVERTVHYIYKVWLPRSRWQPANLPGMEVFRVWVTSGENPVYDLDCCVPVERI